MGSYRGRSGWKQVGFEKVKREVHTPDNKRERKHYETQNGNRKANMKYIPTSSTATREATIPSNIRLLTIQRLPQLTVPPELRDKLVSGLIEQCSHIVIQGVHVLHQPLICLVVYLRSNIRHKLLSYFLTLTYLWDLKSRTGQIYDRKGKYMSKIGEHL